MQEHYEGTLTNVGGRTPIFKVTEALVRDMTRDTDGGTTVSDTGREGRDVTSFVTASETKVVVGPVHSDVLDMAL